MIPALLFLLAAAAAWAILLRLPPGWYDVATRRRGWRPGAGPSYPTAFVGDHQSLTTANTNRDFSAGSMPTIATGVTGGKAINAVLVSISVAIAAATEIGLAIDNGSIKIPIDVIPIAPFTPSVYEPTRVFLFPLRQAIQLPTTSDLLLGRIHTTDTVKVRAASVKFQ